jgi:outer membrane immunogenic protein
MATRHCARIKGKIMSVRIVTRRSPTLHRARRPRSYLANLAAAPAIALAPLLAIALTAAQGADLPVKAPAAGTYSWAGCYVGVNAGGGGSGSSFTTTVGNGTHLGPADAASIGPMGGTGSENASNFLGGGQAGCNWQSGTLVYGLEGDVDYFPSNPQLNNGTGTLSTGDTFTVTQSLKTAYFATVRPRLGVAADRNLAYITGGAAFTTASYTQTYLDALNGGALPGSGTASGSKSLVGWTIGAGWEHAWTDHWTFKLEYLFTSFATTNALGAIVDTAGGTNPLHGSADLVVQTARAGVNYKF